MCFMISTQRFHAASDVADAHGTGKGKAVHLPEGLDLHGTGKRNQSIGNQIELIRKETDQKQQQNFKGFQPGASAQQKPGAEVDTSKMNYDELCAYLAENPDANLGE